MLVNGDQLLLQSGNEKLLTTMLFVSTREVFRSFLNVVVGSFFAFDVSPRYRLCVSGSRKSFRLSRAGNLLLGC